MAKIENKKKIVYTYVVELNEEELRHIRNLLGKAPYDAGINHDLYSTFLNATGEDF